MANIGDGRPRYASFTEAAERAYNLPWKRPVLKNGTSPQAGYDMLRPPLQSISDWTHYIRTHPETIAEKMSTPSWSVVAGRLRPRELDYYHADWIAVIGGNG